MRYFLATMLIASMTGCAFFSTPVPVDQRMSTIPVENAGSNLDADDHSISTKGTMVLVLILLAAFVVYYFANWQALSDVWPVR